MFPIAKKLTFATCFTCIPTILAAYGAGQEVDAASSQPAREIVVNSDDANAAQIAPSNNPSEAEENFFAMLQRMQDFLSKQNSVRLTVVKENSTDTIHATPIQMVLMQNASSAENQLPHIRLEMRKDDESPSFIVDWDGKTLTRWFSTENAYSQTQSKDLRQDLRQCQFTADLLSSVNADFLLQPDLTQFIKHQLIHIRNLGDDSTGLHYQMELPENKMVDVWFDNDVQRPVPVKMKAVSYAPSADSTMQPNTWESQFKWELQESPTAIPTLKVPEDARQVDSIMDALLGVDSSSVLNKVVPSIKCITLDGKEIDLKDFAVNGSKPTLLYFWATWAAPSVRELESVKEYANKLSESGVRIQTINVAETQQQVLSFRSENKLQNNVWLDSNGEAAKAFSLSHLPSAVVLDQQGIVRGIFEKVGNQNRQDISELLQSMLQNK